MKKALIFLQKEYLGTLSLIAFLGAILTFGNNVQYLWNAPTKIERLEKRIKILEQGNCNALQSQKNILLSTANTFQAILTLTENTNTQAIEIIKNLGKSNFETQAEEINKLKKQCNA